MKFKENRWKLKLEVTLIKVKTKTDYTGDNNLLFTFKKKIFAFTYWIFKDLLQQIYLELFAYLLIGNMTTLDNSRNLIELTRMKLEIA